MKAPQHLFLKALLLSLTAAGCGHHFRLSLENVEGTASTAGLNVAGQVRCRVVGVPDCAPPCFTAQVYENIAKVSHCPQSFDAPLWAEHQLATVDSCQNERMGPETTRPFSLTSNAPLADDVIVYVSAKGLTEPLCFMGSGQLKPAEFDTSGSSFGGAPIPDRDALYSLNVQRIESGASGPTNEIKVNLDLGCEHAARLTMQASWNARTCQAHYDFASDEQSELAALVSGVLTEQQRLGGDGAGDGVVREHLLTAGYQCSASPAISKRAIERQQVSARLDAVQSYPPASSEASYVVSGGSDLLAFIKQIVVAQSLMTSPDCPAEWPSVFEID